MPSPKRRDSEASLSISQISILWDVLTDEEKIYLEQNHSTIRFKKNQIIYKEGEKPTGLLCLGSGKVKIYKEGFGGRDQIVRMANPPGFIGYRALFAEENHVATAVVIESCVIFLIKREVINYLMTRNNNLCMNFVKCFATELGFARFRTVTLTQKHIRGRLAESLMLLREIYGYEPDGATINVSISREDLANFSNMTTSNAIRTLSTFVVENVIEVDGRNIKILEEEKLQRISELG